MSMSVSGRVLPGCALDGSRPIDISTGRPVPPRAMRRMLDGWQVSGYFETPQQERFAVTHRGELIGLDGARPNGRFQMPIEMAAGYRMPMWNFLFELHNGRIFRDWRGDSYYLVSLIGALSLLIVSLAGLYDWTYRKTASGSVRAGGITRACRRERSRREFA